MRAAPTRLAATSESWPAWSHTYQLVISAPSQPTRAVLNLVARNVVAEVQTTRRVQRRPPRSALRSGPTRHQTRCISLVPASHCEIMCGMMNIAVTPCVQQSIPVRVRRHASASAVLYLANAPAGPLENRNYARAAGECGDETRNALSVLFSINYYRHCVKLVCGRL